MGQRHLPSRVRKVFYNSNYYHYLFFWNTVFNRFSLELYCLPMTCLLISFQDWIFLSQLFLLTATVAVTLFERGECFFVLRR
jgi:hypothetical protein